MCLSMGVKGGGGGVLVGAGLGTNLVELKSKPAQIFCGKALDGI